MQFPSKAQFGEAVGSAFEIAFDQGAPVVLTLDELEDKGHLDSGALEHFTLFFSGPADQLLEQAAYHLAHPELGTHFIFLVPIDAHNGRAVYQAVFSLSHETQAS